jgi:hypothetical protein
MTNAKFFRPTSKLKRGICIRYNSTNSKSTVKANILTTQGRLVFWGHLAQEENSRQTHELGAHLAKLFLLEGNCRCP